MLEFLSDPLTLYYYCIVTLVFYFISEKKNNNRSYHFICLDNKPKYINDIFYDMIFISRYKRERVKQGFLKHKFF